MSVERWGFASCANLGLASIESRGLESFEYFGLGFLSVGVEGLLLSRVCVF